MYCSVDRRGSESSESECSSPELEPRRDMERQGRDRRARTGYGDLCRYFQRALTHSQDSQEAQDVSKLGLSYYLPLIAARWLGAW